jgi:Zn-dependent peptidase ImmA (M78 family)
MGKVIYLKIGEGKNMDKKEIAKIAKKIIEEYSPNDLSVDPAKIALKLGIPVREVEFKSYMNDSISGGIIKEKDSIKIYVSNSDAMNRKRFTIAHELGHYFLNHLENKGEYVDLHRGALYTNNPDEIDADEFAACLLMEADQVKSKYKILKNVGFQEESIIARLANVFIVSPAAMRTRLKNLELI